MKKLKYLVIAALSVLTLTSCEDFFDTNSDSAIGEEAVFETPQSIEKSIISIYDTFYQERSYRNRLVGAMGTNSDIERNRRSQQANSSQYAMTLVDDEFSRAGSGDVWSWLGSAIEKANLTIEGIEKVHTSEPSDAAIAYQLGEALTLRAFVYLDMIKIWGDVPLLDRPIDPTNLNVPKADRNRIFEMLRTDLRRAADLMGWSEEIAWTPAKNNVGRPNKAFALGLLARSNMMYAGYALRPDTWIQGGGASWSVQYNVQDAALKQELYQDAFDACGEIIAHYGTDKLKTVATTGSNAFEQVFRDLCEDKLRFSDVEWIWVMPFRHNDGGGARGQFLNQNTINANVSSTSALGSGNHAMHALKNLGTGATTGSFQTIVPTLVYDFEYGDQRKWVTIAPFNWRGDNATGLSSNVGNRENWFDGLDANERRLYQHPADTHLFFLGKFRVEWMNRNRTGTEDGIDYPIMRYADILLMYAEAGDAIGNTAYAGAMTTQAAFDAVRARAGLSPVTLNLDNIIRERAFEFCGEQIRKYDLMRWGILSEKLIEAANRVEDLRLGQGEFAGRNDNFYFKYQRADDLIYVGPNPQVTKGFVIDYGTIWGLGKTASGDFETGEPAGFDSTWVPRTLVFSDNANLTPANYVLYRDAATIDNRHYWPIFASDIAASNNVLWNDYGW